MFVYNLLSKKGLRFFQFKLSISYVDTTVEISKVLIIFLLSIQISDRSVHAHTENKISMYV